MKIHKIKVNGKLYEVQLESVEENDQPIVHEPVKVEQSAQGEQILAPMQGNILRVDVEVGQQVNKGDCLLILEAMKLENEILAPVSGRVVQVAVSKGQTVNTNDLLVVLG